MLADMPSSATWPVKETRVEAGRKRASTHSSEPEARRSEGAPSTYRPTLASTSATSSSTSTYISPPFSGAP